MLVQVLTIIFFCNQLIGSKADDVINFDPNANYTHLMEVLNRIPFSECIEHLLVVAEALDGGNLIAMKMLDASAKPQAGLLSGNIIHVGNYDECLEINERISRHRIQGKYCSAILQPHPHYGGELEKLFASIMDDFRLNDDDPSVNEDVRMSYGFCVPKSCTAEDLQDITELIEDELQLPVHFSFSDKYCDGGDGREFTTSTIFAIIIFSMFAILLISGTLYEYFIYETLEDSGRKINFLMAFSVISNGKKLLSTSTSKENLNCLNGLRVISMMWIILGHGFMSSFYTPHINAKTFLTEWQKQIRNSIIISGTMGVDTFFVVSGLLVTYLFMKQQSKGIKFSLPMFYIHRLWRLTPSLAMVILFTTCLLNHMGSGPFWPLIDEMYVKQCEKYWWATLTYFQVYINPNEQCAGQAWYLSVDTQMYFISPLILFPLLRWPKQTIGALVVFIALNCSYVFEITWKKHLGTTFLDQNEAQYNYLYVPTHIRGTAYLIGMICGYFVFQTRTNTPLKLTKYKLIFLWVASLSIMVGIVLSHHTVASPYYNVLDSSIFNSLTRVGWSVALSVVILLCVNNYGGAINSFLSNDVFNVLIRLNYSAYLLHINVLAIVVGQERTSTYFSNLMQFHQFWGDYFFLLGASLIWTLAFESPFVAFEKIIFEKKKTKINNGNHLDNGILTGRT